MKLQITFKDPDGVRESLEGAKLDPNKLPKDVEEIVRKFIEYNEYVTIEFDTDTKEAIVVPV